MSTEVRCRRCGRTVGLRLDGTLRHHTRRDGSPVSPTCPGSYQKPTEATT